MARLWQEWAGKWLGKTGSSEGWSGEAGIALPLRSEWHSPRPDGFENDCKVLATEQLGVLAGAIESEIIPRLMMAYRADMEAVSPPVSDGLAAQPRSQPGPGGHQTAIRQRDVEELTQLLLTAPTSAVRNHCEAMRARDVPVVQMLLHLLAPTARRLGELWDNDEVDFTSVAIALCSLQQLMRELARSAEPDQSDHSGPENRRVLLAPVPGEQHTFGVLMVAEFFQRAGWEVAGHGALDGQELLRLARSEWFAVIGVSASQEATLEEVTALIEQLRRVSRNREVSVLVGGRPFAENPELFRSVGADATATDAEGAVAAAEQLLTWGVTTPSLKSCP